nr:MAG TPA: protein of unknown function DUF4314 [Caudoviricetes sp.]
MKTEYTSIKVGDRIRILHLRDEDKSYDGREGIVEFIDSLNQLHGTWGGLAIIPEIDELEVISASAKTLTEAEYKNYNR